MMAELWTSMEILVNGTARQVRDDFSIADLIEDMALANKRIAVEVNLSIVPRSQYAAHLLRPSDRVEIVHAIGGGQPSWASPVAPHMDVAALAHPCDVQRCTSIAEGRMPGATAINLPL